MNLVLLTVGKPKADFAAQGIAEYCRRLKPFGGCHLEPVRAEKGGKNTPPEKVSATEGGRILERLRPRDQVWVLDEKGQSWPSEQWAQRLDQARLGGAGRLVLVVGGAWGLDSRVVAQANHLISLGPITLPHELAALVASEQLYRAHTILAGLPYHHGG